MVTVKWGIMGSDDSAHQFAESFPSASAELLAVSSRTLQKSYDFSQVHAILKAYGSHEELAYDPEVDMVFIAVPDAIMKDTLLMVLKAGKHAAFIKPHDFPQDDMDKLVELAHKKRRLFAVVNNPSSKSFDIEKLNSLCLSFVEKEPLNESDNPNLN